MRGYTDRKTARDVKETYSNDLIDFFACEGI